MTTTKPPRKKYRFKTREAAEEEVQRLEFRARWLLWLYMGTASKTTKVIAKSGDYSLSYIKSPSGFSEAYVYQYWPSENGCPHLVFWESVTEAQNALRDSIQGMSFENPDREAHEKLYAGLTDFIQQR